MCYEAWRFERISAEEQAARQKAAELIDKVRATRPAPEQPVPAGAEQQIEQETIPA